MRLRVLVILGALLCLIAVLLSVFMLRNISSTTTQEVQLTRSAAMNRFVQLATHATNTSDLGTLQLEMDTYSELFDEPVLVNIGRQQLSSGGIDPRDPEVSSLIRSASLNLEETELPLIRPLESSSALMSRPFGNATQVLGSVIMEVNLDTARSTILRSWSLVIAATISACAALLLLANRLSTWVLRPVQQLIRAVTELARTQKPSPLQEAGPPELRALSRSFGEMAQSVSKSLSQQRELIAETSHQLRNPIAALRLRVDLLKLRLGDQAQGSEIIAVDKELQRMESLIDAVLSLASAEHRASASQAISADDPEEKEVQPVPAASMLREETERQRVRSIQVNTPLIMIDADGWDNEASVECNEFELQMMLEELITNALKYAQGKPVELNLQLTASDVEFCIRDHGPGLHADEIKLVTKRFWRSEGSRIQPGTGLGMSIVSSLAQANHGSLFVQNAEGSGLLVRLVLPRSWNPDGKR